MFDFITVVFQEELPLLKIQARSFDQYVPNDAVNQITIVVNDTNNLDIDTAWWGTHATKVVIRKGTQFNLSGWESQQLLKLLAASESTAEWAFVLDAKTWFIKEFDQTRLFSSAGKPWSGTTPGKPGVFAQARAFVEDYYNIKMPEIVGPNGVPFMFHVATVKEMIDNIPDFATFFQANVQGPNFLTEFFLYSGYVIKKFGSIDQLYGTTHTYLYPMNIAANEADKFDELFGKIKKYQSVLTASIHRGAYSKISQENLLTWVKFLQERNLINNELETIKVLNTYIK